MSIDFEKAQKLVALQEAKRNLNRELKNINGSIAELESDLLDQFASSPVSRFTIAGHTLSVKRTLLAGIDKQYEDEPTQIAYDRACKVLTEMGLDEFVGDRFLPSTLSAYMRELDRDGLPVPEQWEGAIKVFEKYTIGVRKA